MFLENDFARPLFDFVKGGPPHAYECLVCELPHKITRTERGMRMHLKLVHEWEEQPYLYSTEIPSHRKSGSPEKLRAVVPNLKPENDQVKDMEKIPTSQLKLAVMNENELLNSTKKEN